MGKLGQEVFAAGNVVMIASFLRHFEVDWLSMPFRPVVIVLYIEHDWLTAYGDCARLHQRLHVPYHVVLSGPKIPKLAVDYAAVVRDAHPFALLFFRIDYKSAGPKLYVIEDSPCSHEALPVHVFENANAMHRYDGAQAESDQSDGFALPDFRLEQKDCEQRSAETSLIVRKDELFLTRGEHVQYVQDFLHSGLLFAAEDALVEEVETVAGRPLERVYLRMLVECHDVRPGLLVIFKLLKEAADHNHNMLAFCFRIAHSVQLQHCTPLD